MVGQVDLIQSVSSLRLANEINKAALKADCIQDILLEVNIGREAAKKGFSPELIKPVLNDIQQLKNIRVRGLMAIPPILKVAGGNNVYFDEMRQLFVDISTEKYDNISMYHLSMGMSNDYEDAILHGSNMVRIGSAIFGERHYV